MSDSLKPKRKNDDDKPKGLPRRWKAGMIGLVLLIGIIGAGLILRTAQAARQPTGHLYYRIGDDNYTLDYDLNLKTGERLKIEDDSALRESFPDTHLSPDGQWTVKWGSNPNGSRMRLVFQRTTHETGTPVITIVPMDSMTYGLSWSPDSQGILTSGIANPTITSMSREQMTDLWLISPHGDKTRLTNNAFMEQGASFSPDGRYIAYRATPDGYYRVYVMELATGTITLVNPDMYAYSYTWSPDSQWLAFESDHTGQSDIWIVGRDGADLQAVALTDEWERGPIWLP